VASCSEEDWESIGIQWREAAEMNGEARLHAPSFIQWLKRSGYIKDYVCVPPADFADLRGKI
jgi:hypothetical protein